MIHHNSCNAKRRKNAVTFSIVKLHLVALRLSDYLSKTHFARDFLQKWKWDSSKVTLLQGRQILRLLRTSDTPMSPKTAPVPKTDAPTISPDTAPVMKNDSPPSPNLSATSSFLFFLHFVLQLYFLCVTLSFSHSFLYFFAVTLSVTLAFCDFFFLWLFSSCDFIFLSFFLSVTLSSCTFSFCDVPFCDFFFESVTFCDPFVL